MIERFRLFLWNWMFLDYAKQCDVRLEKFFAEKAKDFQEEHTAFMRELRENMREEASHAERRHREMVDAFKGMRRE